MPSSFSSKSNQARQQQARHGSSGSALASRPKQADVVVGDVVMVVIKNQGATEFAKARVLQFKDHANGTKAQAEIVEEDIGDHPIGTKLRAIATGDDDGDDDELQEDLSAPKNPPKKKTQEAVQQECIQIKQQLVIKSLQIKQQGPSADLRVPAKKQLHQRNRPSISDYVILRHHRR
jgi:hypothetical protein